MYVVILDIDIKIAEVSTFITSHANSLQVKSYNFDNMDTFFKPVPAITTTRLDGTGIAKTSPIPVTVSEKTMPAKLKSQAALENSKEAKSKLAKSKLAKPKLAKPKLALKVKVSSTAKTMAKPKPKPKPKSRSKPKSEQGFGEEEEEDGNVSSEGESLEDIFQKKTPLEHILLRPDTYVGSINLEEFSDLYVLSADSQRMEQRPLTIAPGLYKIFDEILVNSSDNKQRDPKGMDQLRVEINSDEGWISVMNTGKGIPIHEHSKHNVFIPTMIFGHLLSGSNFNDAKKKTTGGRNGYGAKLTNIFSSKFTVETADTERGLRFRQTWTDNMTKVGKACTYPYDKTKHEFTKVTFYPDLAKFGMTKLDDDIVALMTKRVWDIAGTTDKTLRVYLNKDRVPINDFKQYCRMYLPSDESKFVYEQVGRWEVAAAPSSRGFQQISYVNNINTAHGGTHVWHVMEKLYAAVRTNKKLAKLHANLIKSNVFIMVNALVENVAFSSQTKLQLTSNVAAFGSRCDLSDKFGPKLCSAGLTNQVLRLVRFEEEGEASKNTDGKKKSNVNIEKLDDANDAGSDDSQHCTLILTEGDSAKTLAVSGLGVVGRDRYGVFPLKGKLLNVRGASLVRAMKNVEITHLKQIMGLVQGRVYTAENIHELRYGHVMIMADQDVDGSHIKGLVINLFSVYWPSLLKIPGFLQEFITPIVKMSKGKISHNFYTVPECNEWIAEIGEDEAARWNTKYYKGLGTSTSKEAKEYFRDLDRHVIDFIHAGENDDKLLEMAFVKGGDKIPNLFDPEGSAGTLLTASDVRKVWIDKYMGPDTFLDQNTDSITYEEFINKELILFADAANQRAIPSIMDGFKPGQRKIWFSCLKRKLKREIKVAQLAGYVGENAAYHHGEMSLVQTIIGLAQNYIGSNNLNLLVPAGQFGTRLSGGKDAASGRYIFTKMTLPIATHLFSEHDFPLLDHLTDDGQSVEPLWYAPTIPMVLVNGTSGVGFGWSTNLPSYNPRDIIRQINRLLNGETLEEIMPWYRGFQGTVVVDNTPDKNAVITSGKVVMNDNVASIRELPIGMWTSHYKTTKLDPLYNDKKITNVREFHTDTTVHFEVTIHKDEMAAVNRAGALKYFDLSDSLSLNNVVMFDAKGSLCKYNHVHDIMREFFSVKMPLYSKRKELMIRQFEYELKEIHNRRRFILSIVDDELVMRRKPRAILIAELHTAGYWCKPKKTTTTCTKAAGDVVPTAIAASEYAAEEEMDIEDADADGDQDKDKGKDDEAEVGSGFDYLIKMPMSSQTLEKVQALEKEYADKVAELKKLRETDPKDMWRADLNDLEEALVVYEADLKIAEAEADAEQALDVKGQQRNKKSGGGGGGKRKRSASGGGGAKRVKK